MFAEKPVSVMPPLRLHSEVTDSLSRAKTPLEVLTALTREGAEYGVEVWAMAISCGQKRMTYLCSVAPMQPAAATGQLAHFLAHCGNTGAEGCAWADENVAAVCLRPDLPPTEHDLAEYRDMELTLGDGDVVVIRAAALKQDQAGKPNWSRAQATVQFALPYLRALDLRDTNTRLGMIDPESGTYSWPYFLDALEREVERSRRSRDELALAVLELRPIGTAPELTPDLHRRVGAHVAQVVRRTDMVGRIGPRSYAIFFHNTSPRPALIAAGRIAEALRNDEEVISRLSFSVGLSGWEGEGLLETTSLLAQAGEAAAEAGAMAPDRAFVYL